MKTSVAMALKSGSNVRQQEYLVRTRCRKTTAANRGLRASKSWQQGSLTDCSDVAAGMLAIGHGRGRLLAAGKGPGLLELACQG